MTTPAAPSRRAFVARRAGVILACVAALAIAWLYEPYAGRGPVLCTMRAVTGVPCPGCGMTRAFCALARGHFIDAAGYNALALPIAAALLTAAGAAAAEIALGRRLTFYRFAATAAFAWAVLAAVFVYYLGHLASLAHSGRLPIH